MKHLLLSLALFIFVFSAQASHLKGGYITYKWVSGRTYQVTLVTFSDPASPAYLNTVSIKLNFGDGNSETVTRNEQIQISSSVAENIYITTHTYLSDGDFLISYSDQNLIDGIININGGNSKDVPFYIEALLHIDQFIGITNSPQPHSLLPDIAATGGNALSYNSTWFTTKATNQIQYGEDSIYFEIVSLKNIPNYTLPTGLSIDPFCGMISWKNVPVNAGSMSALYYISYIVTSYRGLTQTGYTVVAQIIRVENYPAKFPSTANFPSCDSSNGWYKKSVISNNSFQQEFNYPDSNYHFQTHVYGETNLSLTDSSASSLSKTIIHFISDTNMVQRNRPYFYTVRISRDSFAIPYFRDYTLAIYYGALITYSVRELNNINGEVKVFPNPFKNSCTFTMNSQSEFDLTITDLQGKEILKTKMKDNFKPDFTGLKPGNYFYILQNADGEFATGKLLLQE